MAQARPVIRKTKKSSYKPMSKLNEDSLIDLRRVDKPEYSQRVFYFNTSSRAKLNTSLNVWFRDHQSTMTNIGRQQQAVYRVLCRVKNDQRRVQRQMHKRKQEDLRKDLFRRHQEYTQRRVIRQFRKNAARKMAARGEKSIAAMRLEAMCGRGFDPSLVVSASLSTDQGLDMIDPIIKAASGLSASSDDAVSEHGTKSCKKKEGQRQGTVTRSVNHKHKLEQSVNDSPQNDQSKLEMNDEKEDDESGRPEENSDDVSDTLKTTSGSTVGRPVPELDQQLLKVSRVAVGRKRSSMVSAPPREDLGAIPEVVSPVPSADKEEIIPIRERSASLPVNRGRALEVRKHRPHSPTTRTITSSQNADVSDATSTSNPHRSERGKREEKESSPANVPDTTLQSRQASRRSSSDSQASNAQHKQPSTNVPTRKTVCFGEAPCREKVLADVADFLSHDEGSSSDSGSGSRSRRGSKPGMAAKIRLERRDEARRRAEVLDSEPMVQYYRSVRGTLMPLFTKPNRRVFTPPSNRARYQQVKLLRQEHQKDLTRRSDINKFFNDIFSQQQTGQEAPKPASEDTKSKATYGAGSDVLVSMVNRLRKTTLSGQTASNKNSLEQLAKCQYLRVYHWDKNEEQALPENKATSWDAAQNSLKAGFLALDFSKM